MRADTHHDRGPREASRGDPPSLTRILHRFAERGDNPALQIAGQDAAWSFAVLRDSTVRLAAGLLEAGLERGEPVALLGSNRPEWVCAALAVIAAGGTVVPLDTVMAADDLRHALRDSGCRRAFATADRLETLGAVTAPDDGGAIELDVRLLDRDADGEAGRSWRSLLAAAPAGLPDLGGDDRAALFYTSGTTGRPKGVPLSHANIWFCVEGLLREDLVTAEDRVVLPLPLYHVYPFVVGMLTPMALGIAIVFPEGLTGPQIVAALREGRATVMIGVPRLYTALMDAVRGRLKAQGRVPALVFEGLLGLSTRARRRLGWRFGMRLFRPFRARIAPELELMVSGGARLEPRLARQLEGLGWELLSGYGLTETSPIVTFNTRGRANIETAGAPLKGVEIDIDRSVAPGEEEGRPENGEARDGEILVRGPNVFAGYHGLPDKTEAAFAPGGWFRTGDLGHVDADGFLRIAGRRSETIVLAGGKNIFPEEAETAYQAREVIKEVAVLERDGRLVGIVVPDPEGLRQAGVEPEEAVRQAMRVGGQALPAHLRIGDFVETRQPLPRTPLGKLRRHRLPELYDRIAEGRRAPERRELSEEDASLLSAPEASRVWEFLKRRHPDRPVALDADLQADLGIDSLEWVTLTLELQDQAGLAVRRDALERVQTVRDLLHEAIRAKAEAPEDAEPETPSAEQEQWIEPRQGPARWLGLMLFGLNRLVLKLGFRHRQSGVESIPASGPVVLTPNHVSFLDAFTVGAGLPYRQMRRVYWAGTTTYLFPNRLTRLFSRAAQVFPVQPGQTGGLSVPLAKRVLERGDMLVWFPEGSISRDGTLKRFMPGLGTLIEGTDAVLVPVHLKGTLEAYPRSRRFPRPRPVSVVYGRPLTQQELIRRGRGDDDRQRLVDALHQEVAALADRHPVR